MLSYVQCFRTMLLLALVAIPVVLLMRPPRIEDGGGVHRAE